jgi:Domain of Unknown Function with PDB structure (DUF3857)/Protein of unknown function (DUF2569)
MQFTLKNLTTPLYACVRAYQRVFAFVCISVFALLPTATLAAQEFNISARPNWVQTIEPEVGAAVPLEQVNNGVFYLLSDVQDRADGRDIVRYRHVASKAVNATGVEKIAQVEMRFDPSYEKLSLHAVNVRRDGVLINKLNAASVRILQREKELEYQIYDGSKTANIFLEDVRVGDVVEYAYSLRGANPVFGGRHFGSFTLQWKSPVNRSYVRLLWPSSREIYFTHHRTDKRPRVQEAGQYREYLWDQSALKPLMVEDDTPDWYDPYPFVEWNEFKDWESVARWAVPLYARTSNGSTQGSIQLRAEIERIKLASTDAKDRLLAALRFAQREIRYLGVEIGAGSHAPNSPDTVITRRFGDCKDKSFLVVTMLHELGIDAKPALVNTRINRGVNDLHPSPGAFNHVIVRAQIGESIYWVDPTRPSQKGTLATLYQPSYGSALVVDLATRELEMMKNVRPYKRTVRSFMDSSAGFDKPVPYTITTELEGESAEWLRNKIANQNSADFQKQRLNFYARFYADIAIAAPIKFEDDEVANKMVMTESYVVKNFWPRDETKKRLEMNVYSHEVRDFSRAPKESIRTLPLAIEHPIDVTHVNEVLLPQKWSDSADTTKVDDATFSYEQNTTYKDKKLVMRERLQSLADHIQPTEMSRYTANLQKVRSAMGQSLFWNDEKSSAAPSVTTNVNWAVMIGGVGMLIVFLNIARGLYRYDPPGELPVVDSSLRGFGGWLILPAIGVVVTPFVAINGFMTSLPSFGLAYWNTITNTADAAYQLLLPLLLIFELGYYIALLVFSLLLIVVFFQKRRVAPMIFIGISVGGVIFTAVDLVCALQISSIAVNVGPKDWGGLAKQVMALAIWGTYFLRSRRVKSTFVNTWRANKQPAEIKEIVHANL